MSVPTNPLEIRASFKDLHVIVHFEQWSQGRRVKQGDRVWEEEKTIQGCVVRLFTVVDNWDSISPGPSKENPSCSSELSPQRMRRGALIHQFPHASRPSTVKSCHMGKSTPLTLPVLCMPEWWVDSWAESRDRRGSWGKVVSGYTCMKPVAAATPC